MIQCIVRTPESLLVLLSVEVSSVP